MQCCRNGIRSVLPFIIQRFEQLLLVAGGHAGRAASGSTWAAGTWDSMLYSLLATGRTALESTRQGLLFSSWQNLQQPQREVRCGYCVGQSSWHDYAIPIPLQHTIVWPTLWGMTHH